MSSLSSASTYPFTTAWLEVNINEPAINKTVRQIQYIATTLKGYNKIAWLLKAINLIDLTTLNGYDTSSNVLKLCEEASTPSEKLTFKWPLPLHTAAVCVYPLRVPDAVKALKDFNKAKDINVASVAAGFPSGQFPLESTLEEIRYCIKHGAKEIDIVINRSLVLNHEWQNLYNQLYTIRSICDPTICIKTILATGELFNLKDVYKASMVAMMAGANFIKTSTGKETINATLPVGIVMCRAISDFESLTGKKVGLKPAGGIKSAQDALEWMVLIKEQLGNSWMTNKYFRIGASSLLDNITSEIVKAYSEDIGLC